jgi:hypothetical protein
MATPIVITAKTDEALRIDAARDALSEMHFLMEALDKSRAMDDAESEIRFDVLWRALSVRIRELNNAALVMLLGEGSSSDLLDTIHGPNWIIGTEAACG